MIYHISTTSGKARCDEKTAKKLASKGLAEVLDQIEISRYRTKILPIVSKFDETEMKSRNDISRGENNE